ncbi:MAG TPA: MotA/TolQ/ExbB proton channel family protein [Sedimentisphaerales bacterium]|nr:MotA/TolQ/ExbB proton channel family protein [Sedimentisphaerales bacterium]HNU31764.1 MotA/TolQ/ExbB proton channel family protein [Sedimentisphaerales bacterium]
MSTERIAALWGQAVAIWLSGGWGMIALAINGLVLFALGIHVFFRLREKGGRSVGEKTWRRWIDHPTDRRGPLGELLDFVTGAKSLKQSAVFFEELRATEIRSFERDLRVMKVCVSSAPLLGLLGTVTGMLATFGALASGAGGEKTMALVAGGISEALVTTETGLIIALPGLFFQYQLARRLERYKAFLTQLETVCTQKLYKTLHRPGEMEHDQERTTRLPEATPVVSNRTHRKGDTRPYVPGRSPQPQELAA